MDFSLVDMERYITEYDESLKDAKRVLWIVSSRGCPFNCGFCYNKVFNMNRWRGHSAEFMIKKINDLTDKYKIDFIRFMDDNFFGDFKRAEKIIRNIKVPYFAEGMIHYITPGFAGMLKETRCRELMVGVESGSDRMLKLINKPFKTKDVVNSIRIMQQYAPGVRIGACFIFGLPTETLEEFRSTVRLLVELEKIHKNIIFNPQYFLPYPGTQLYELAKEMGFKPPTKTEDWDQINNYFTKKDSKYSKPWVEWKENFETANIRNYIFMLWYLDIYRIPNIFKRITRWRMRNSNYFLPIDVILFIWVWRILRYGSSQNAFLRSVCDFLRRFKR